MLILAQSAAAARSGTRAAIWALALIAVVMLLGAGLMILRRRLFDSGAPDQSGTFLEHLRELHRQGRLSDEEFAQARAKLQASMRRALDQQAAARDASRPPRPVNRRGRGDNPGADPIGGPPRSAPRSPPDRPPGGKVGG
jgi:hypothetical protein